MKKPADAAELVIESKRRRGLSDKTLETATYIGEMYTGLVEGLDIITPDDIDTLWEAANERTDKSQYLNIIWQHMCQFLRKAREIGVVEPGALDHLYSVKVVESVLPTCKEDEFEKLLSAQTHKHMRLALMLAYYEGMRTKEVALLRSENVDLKERTIKVPVVKTTHRRRLPIFPLPPNLPGHKEDRLFRALKARMEDPPEHGYLACWSAANPHSPGFRYRLYKTCDSAGIRRLPFHSMRHGFARWSALWGNNGRPADFEAIRLALGHTSGEMTQRYLRSLEGMETYRIQQGYGVDPYPPIPEMVTHPRDPLQGE